MNVHLYYGDESYLLNREVSKLRADLISPDMAALSHKILAQPEVHEVLEAVTAVAFSLGGNTIIEVRQFRALEKTARDDGEAAQLEELKEALKDLEPTKHVLFVNKKVDRKIKFPKWLAGQKSFDVKAFKQFNFWETEKAADLLMAIALDKDISLSQGAAHLLVENMGVSLQPLINEVEKLSVYANGRTITRDDVVTLSNHCENTFQMIGDWIKNGSRSSIYHTLDELLLRQHPNPLYGLTQSQLNHVFCIRYLRQMGYSEQDIAEQLKKHPYKIKKDLQEFQQVPLHRLAALKETILDFEWKYKTGQLDARLSYELLMGS